MTDIRNRTPIEEITRQKGDALAALIIDAAIALTALALGGLVFWAAWSAST